MQRKIKGNIYKFIVRAVPAERLALLEYLMKVSTKIMNISGKILIIMIISRWYP